MLNCTNHCFGLGLIVLLAACTRLALIWLTLLALLRLTKDLLALTRLTLLARMTLAWLLSRMTSDTDPARLTLALFALSQPPS